MGVADGKADGNFLAALQRLARVVNQLVVERFLQAMVLLDRAVASHARGHVRIVKHGGKIQAAGFPVVNVAALGEAIDAAHHFIQLAETELRHDLPQVFGDIEEEIDHVLGLALEFLAQHGVLRRHAHGAGVQVALAHHDAAQGNQRQGGETKFLRAQQGGNGHVAAGLKLSIHLQAHAAAQVVHHQRLLRFGEAEFPGNSRVANRGDRRGAGAAVVAADQDDVGMRLGHARRHRSHARFRHQLDGNPGLRIHVLEVVDELRQVLDGIDIVVRRRRDQAARREWSGARGR